MAQWLERPTGIWKVMGLTPVGGSGNSFSEYFGLRTLLRYLNNFVLQIYSRKKAKSVTPYSFTITCALMMKAQVICAR